MRLSRATWAFIALVALLSAPFYYIVATAGIESPWVAGLMWAPGLAALIVVFATTRSLRGLGWGLKRPMSLLWAVLIPLGYCALVYGAGWLTGVAGISVGTFVGNLITSPILLLSSAVVALGEELGWRGFLMPDIVRANPFVTSVTVTAVVWATWHVPVMIWGGYNAGTPLWYGLPWFVISVAGTTVILGWLRFRSNSVWPPTIYHAAHNVFIQSVFGAAATGKLAPWVLGEFGPAAAVTIALVALVVWRRGVVAADEWCDAEVSPA